MKKQEKSLNKSFRWTSAIKPVNAVIPDDISWTTYGGNFKATNMFKYDAKEIEMKSIGKQKQYKMLSNLRKGSVEEPKRNYGFLTGNTGV